MNMRIPPSAGVIGWPINHSKSPRLHGEWLKRYGISGSYERVAAAPEDFETTVRDLVSDGWRGANVTLPHKEAALALADEVSDRAKAIGAANTLVFRENGAILADNTDGFGFIANLDDRAAGRWRREEPALVLGAGGASRAVIHALLEEGAAEVRLSNRTTARARSLKEVFGDRVKVVRWDEAEDALAGAGLVVNTTSLGMSGQPPLDFSFHHASEGLVVTDIVYSPLITPLLERAAAAGLAVADGLGMLLHQGRPGFQAWFGVMPDVDEDLRKLMIAP